MPDGSETDESKKLDTKPETAAETESGKRPGFDANDPVFRQDSKEQQLKAATEAGKGNSELAPLAIVGDKQAETSKPSAQASQYLSWSNGSLESALKHLEDNRRAGEAKLNQIASGGDRAQSNLYGVLKNQILPRLKAEGKLAPEWQIYPTQPQSPADKIGADYLLVNSKTGQFHLLDATERADKGNVYSLRKNGVFVVDNTLFDRMGALKIDEDGVTGEKARNLQQEIESRIEKLGKEQSPFKLGPDGVPMPSLTPKSAEETLKEVNRLSDWAAQKAREAKGSDPGFREMSEVVKRAGIHTEITLVEKPSPKLKESARRVVEDETARAVFAKYKGTKLQTETPGKESDVKLHKDGNIKMQTASGERLDGGNISEHIDGALRTLVSEKSLLARLSNGQLKEMGADTTSFAKLKGAEREAAIEKALKAQPKFKAEAKKLMEKYYDIKRGESKETIAENTIARLRSRSQESLLGIQPKEVPAAASPELSQPKPQEALSKRGISSSAEELFSYHQNEKFEAGKASSQLAETMELLILEQNEKQSWPKGELEKFKELFEAYKDPKHPEHQKAVSDLHEWLEARGKAESENSAAAQIESRLEGNQTFERLRDQSRLNDSIKQMNDRMDRLPKLTNQQGEFLTQQLKSALRKHLGVSTDNKLPESVRGLSISVEENGASTVRFREGKGGPVLEVPAKLLKDNPRAAIAEIYANASGLCMLDLAGETEQRALTMRAIKPTLDKIVAAAEAAIDKTQASEKSSAKPAAELAASDRSAEIKTKTQIATVWEGDNLSFGGEKFHMRSELENLRKERESKVKALQEELASAKEKAEASKNAEDLSKVQSIEKQLLAERQNLQITSDLNLALEGRRGLAAQEKARSILKDAADRALNEHLSRGGGSAGLSRFAALTMVVTAAVALYAEQVHAQPTTDRYQGSFR